MQLDAERALHALRALPDVYRTPLMLRLVHGLTGPEIADRLGMTHGSVRVNLHRGMTLLRTALGRGGPMNDDYLWDGTGTPDPVIASLEQSLLGLRAPVVPLATIEARAQMIVRPVPRKRVLKWALGTGTLAAAVVASSVVLARLERGDQRAQALAADSTATERSDGVDTVRLLPRQNTRVAVRGSAAPTVFFAFGGRYVTVTSDVIRTGANETASPKDLARGVEYDVVVDTSRVATIGVSVGQLAIVYGLDSALVPQGNALSLYPDGGVGLPFPLNASTSLRDAIWAVDSGGASREHLEALLSVVTARGTIALWHLLPRLSTEDRTRALSRMLALVPASARVPVTVVSLTDADVMESWRKGPSPRVDRSANGLVAARTRATRFSAIAAHRRERPSAPRAQTVARRLHDRLP